MLGTLELDYVKNLERGYCIDHPDVIAHTKEQVVDRAVKQLLEALQANGFELDENILKRSDGWLKYDESKWQYSNDAGSTWHDMGSGGGAGDMLRSVYDIDNVNIVDKAKALDDGTHSATAEAVADHLADSSILVLVDTTAPSAESGKLKIFGKAVSTSLIRSLPKRGSRPMLSNKVAPYLINEDGLVRAFCVLDENNLIAVEQMPASAMLKTTYDASEHGRVTNAENLNDGDNSISAATVVGAITGAASYSKVLTQVGTPDTPASGKAILYLFLNGSSQELHIKFENGIDKVITTDAT